MVVVAVGGLLGHWGCSWRLIWLDFGMDGGFFYFRSIWFHLVPFLRVLALGTGVGMGLFGAEMGRYS